MILGCKSCDKKFVVPDNAIPASGRMVQCSSCGNKWKQFPITDEKKAKKTPTELKPTPIKIVSSIKTKKRKVRKKTGPNLYSPEYLAKKHGININEKTVVRKSEANKKKEISFGFYNFLFTSIIVIIFVLKSLHFSQAQIILLIPESSIYLDYLFESIKNIKEIILNFFVSY
jgi:predicted Zn finger-like uncharacterized protein